jgi:hypothetical protein
MKVLKGFGVGILSFLLFLSLSVFGMAFMLNNTLLNPDFVAAEVDKIDVSTLTRELTEEQIGEQLPEEALFLKEAIYGVISDHEPWLKEQINTAIYSSYDFFLGKSETLNVAISLEPLKESLRDSLWQTFNEQLPLLLPDLLEYQLKPYLDQHYEEFIEQIPQEYLPPEFSELPEDLVKPFLYQFLEEIAGQMATEELPPEISALLEDLLQPYFDQYYQEFAGQIPSELTLDETAIPPEVMAQLLQVRQYIGYFQTAYNYLIGFMVLLVLGIILIHRNVRDATRALGVDLLIYGALEFAAVYFARNFALTGLPLPNIPSSLQMWLAGLSGDLLAPLQTFSLGVLIGGVVLLVVSFVYKPKMAED